jgi:hypothetical protein
VSDSAGRATALTLILPIRRGGDIWLRLLFRAANHFAYVTAPLRRLSFIHFARWTIIPGPDGRPWLWFESNFDGDLPQYMETFARAVPWRMRAVWGMTERFPGLHPMEAFASWVDANRVEAGHYWCAYPDATTTMAGAGVRVLSRFADFTGRTWPDDEAFAAGFRGLVDDLQADL